MNCRERFQAVMHLEDVDRTLLWDCGYWGGTMMRWYGEGLTRRKGLPDNIKWGTGVYGADNADVWDHFGLDPHRRKVPVETGLFPLFEERILADHGTWDEVLGIDGIVRREYKDKSALPHFVRGPVQSPEDWERLKAERLRPDLAERSLEDWPRWVRESRDRDYPVELSFQGLWGFARNLLGVEPLLLSFYDAPELIRDIINSVVDFYIALFDPILAEIDVDLAFFAEDLCYKNGPFAPPQTIREYLLPGYQKLTAFFRSHGVDIIALETDGDCRPLIPLFLEAGITALWPFEATSGQNIVEVRTQYPRLGMFGGLDKKALITGTREAIDAELEAKVPFMLERGGYIPLLDHNASPDISWESYAYYRQRLSEMVLG